MPIPGALQENVRPDAADLLAAIEEMQMIDKIESHYTPEQLDTLKKRGEALGQDYIESIQAEWPALMRRIQEELEKGTDPASPEVKKLVARHEELLHQFHGGDPGMIESMKNLYRSMGDEFTREYDFPMNREMSEFMQKAKESK